MNPDFIVAYLRALLEGEEKEASDEVKTAWDKYLIDRALSNGRGDLRDRTLEFVEVCRRWLRKKKAEFSKLSDEELYRRARNRYLVWLEEMPRDVTALPPDRIKEYHCHCCGEDCRSAEGLMMHLHVHPDCDNGMRYAPISPIVGVPVDIENVGDKYAATPEQELVLKQETKPESRRGRRMKYTR